MQLHPSPVTVTRSPRDPHLRGDRSRRRGVLVIRLITHVAGGTRTGYISGTGGTRSADTQKIHRRSRGAEQATETTSGSTIRVAAARMHLREPVAAISAAAAAGGGGRTVEAAEERR